MAISKRFIILFGLGLAALSLLSASAAEREEPVMVSAIWLNPQTPPVDLYIKGYNDQLRRLIVGTYNRGLPIRIKQAGKPVVILGKVIEPPPPAPAVPPAKPVVRYVPVGEVAWPEGEHSAALLILVPVSTPDQPLKIVGRSLDDDLKAFPADSLRVLNFTTTRLIGQIGKEVKTIEPGTSVMVRYPTTSDLSRPPISYLSVKLLGGGLLYDNGIDAWRGSRALALIYEENDAEKKKTIPVRIVIDVPQVTEADAAQATPVVK